MRMRWLLVTLAVVVQALSITGAESRGAELDCRVTEVASRLDPSTELHLTMPDGNPVTGEEAKLAWAIGTRSLRGDTYLVLAMPADTRFKGDGFMALPPGARAPRSIRSHEESSRVIVPVSGPLANPRGSLAVMFYGTGPQRLSWEIVQLPTGAASPCTEVTLARGDLGLQILPGRPQLVTQNRFSEEAPKSIQESDRGRYLLYDYGERYEVIEATTGDLLVSHAGTGPRFSSEGRYVTSFDGSKRLEVVDIVAQKVIYASSAVDQGDYGGVVVAGWLNHDSLLLLGYGRKGGIGITVPLIDDRTIFGSVSCNACEAFGSISILLDFDRLTIQAKDQDVFQSSLMEIADSPSTIAAWEEAAPEERGPAPRRPRYKALFSGAAHIADRIEAPANSKGDGAFSWLLTDRIQFTIGDVHDPSSQRALLQGRMSQPRFRDVRAPSVLATRGRVVRRIVEVGNTRVSPKSYSERASDAVARFGIRLLPSQEPRRYSPASGPDSTYEKHTESALAIMRKAMTVASTARPPVALVGRNGRLDAAGHLFTRDYDRFSACSPDRVVEGQEKKPPTEEPPIVSANRLTDAWQAETRSGTLFVFQQSDYCGTAPDRYGDLISLFIPKDVNAPLSFKRLAASYSDGGQVTDPEGIDHARASLGNALRLAEEASLYLNIVDDRYLLVVSKDSGFGIVFQLSDMKVLKSSKYFRYPSDLSFVSLTSDNIDIFQLNENGYIAVFSPTSQKITLRGRFIDDEMVLYDNSLAFEATPEGASYVYVQVPGTSQLFTLDQFSSRLRSPGMVRKRLAGDLGVDKPAIGLIPPTLTVRRQGDAYVVEAHSFGTLTKLDVTVDGRLAQTLPLSGSDASLRVPAQDAPAGRWISFVAQDLQGLRSVVSTFLIGREPYGGRLDAVAFGADKFNHARMQNAVVGDLSFAFKDAERFEAGVSRWIAPSYSAYAGKVLSGATTDRSGLIREIEQAAERTGPTDTLMLFIATHGTNTSTGFSLILPSQTPDGQVEEVPFALVSAAIKRARGRVFVFLDACHSAGAGQDAGSEELAATDRNVTVISSSKGQQSSLENAGWGGGAFTTAILSALKDTELNRASRSASPLSVEAVYAEVRRAVVAQTNGKQTPWLRRSVWTGQQSLN